MKIEQFEDPFLSHYSYAILCEERNEIVLIDPMRDPSSYYRFAEENQAKIVAVIETHSHADFVSSHSEIQQHTGALIYMSSETPASFHFEKFNSGDTLCLGSLRLESISTPGHSLDSICILLYSDNNPYALFSGDTLFAGDIGRPDLREAKASKGIQRETLAAMMFDTITTKILPLADEIIVYPTHGAGTLCGKALDKVTSTTIGHERQHNWALNTPDIEMFIKELCTKQPFIPKYFTHAVALNLTGAPDLQPSLQSITPIHDINDCLLIDARQGDAFAAGHIKGAINIMEGTKFETWLGTVLAPDEKFILGGDSQQQLERLSYRTASIGYETNILGTLVLAEGTEKNPVLDIQAFKDSPEAYTILDIRNDPEREEHIYFNESIHIPLPRLREEASSIPTDKPIVVHCAAGYRSAIGSSLLAMLLGGKVEVFDLGEAIKTF